MFEEGYIHVWRRYKVIYEVKDRTKKKTNKFDIRVPRSVKEAHDLYNIIKDTLWRYTITKKIKMSKLNFMY